MTRVLKWSAIGMAVAVLIVAGGAGLYAHIATAAPDAAALAALQSDDDVEVVHEKWLSFIPLDATPTTGLILYPGGFVDPRAYAPIARRIASEGYLVVIPPMPLNLAVLGANRAGRVRDAYPGVERWAVGGHSLGGAIAARYADRNRERVDALVLWAAYPPDSADLSGLDLVSTSVFGTRDGLVSQMEIDDSRARLPSATRFVPIEGGNHAQFGNYGPQKGDRHAEISAEEQQSQAAIATVALLESLAP